MLRVLVYPDAVAMVTGWLREKQPALLIQSRPDPSAKRPVVYINRTGGFDTINPVDEAFISVEVYSPDTRTGVEDAHDVAQIVRAYIKAMTHQHIDGHQVYRVRELSGLQHITETPDERDRWLISFAVPIRGALTE